MVNEAGVREFVSITTEHKRGLSPDSDWLWIVGTGVTASVTGGKQPEATWVGLIQTGIEHIKTNHKTNHYNPNDMLSRLIPDEPAGWRPAEPDELWTVVDIMQRRLGGPETCKKWIAERMQLLETRIVNPDLVDRIGKFGWPIATTNYDNILANLLPGRGWKRLIDIPPHDIESWRRGADASILHIHGHRDKAEGLLFADTDYVRYAEREDFRERMRQLFRGRPVFIGCKDTLTDPNISITLKEHSELHKSFSRNPIVLLRSPEKLDLKIEAKAIYYGDQHEDLIPFLEQSLARRSGNGPSTIRATGGPEATPANWLEAYYAAAAREYKQLRLPDFRFADRDFPLRLDDIFVALTLDPRTAQERLEEARAVHHTQAARKSSTQEQIAADPYERPSPQISATSRRATLADVLRQHASAILLGDPGTGKTTLTRWLVRQCALARANHSRDITVEALRIDPEAPPDSPPVRVGPAWFPVLVPVAEYATARANLGMDERHRLLAFASDTVKRRLRSAGQEISSEDALAHIKHEAASGTLLLLLDGLDESVQFEQRREIVKEANALIEWLLGIGFTDFEAASRRQTNRILITSRVAGYKYAAFSVEIPHYRVEPLSTNAVERLFRNLFTAVEDSPSTTGLIALQDSLITRLRSGGPQGLVSVASTPLLASALFTLHLAHNGRIPSDICKLYCEMTDLFINREAIRLWPTVKSEPVAQTLREVLRELAFSAFCSPSSQLISEEELREKIRQRPMLDQAASTAPLFSPEGGAFGPLVPKAPGAYGFIHRSFHEYLCAEHLMSPGASFARIVDLAGMPSWTEPARLAFMMWARARNGAHEARPSDIETLRQGTFVGNAFRPLALAIAAAADTSDLDFELLGLLVDTAIDAATAALPYFDESPTDLVEALRSLYNVEEGHAVIEDKLEIALAHIKDIPSRAAAAAKLVTALNLFGPVLVQALQSAYPHDEEKLRWPVTSALLRAVTPPLTDCTDNTDLLTLDAAFKGRYEHGYPLCAAAVFFELHPEITSRLLFLSSASKAPHTGLPYNASGIGTLLEVQPQTRWTRLLTALLGAQRDYRLGESEALYKGMAAFLQLADHRRSEALADVPVQWRIIADARKKVEDQDKPPDRFMNIARFLDEAGGHAMHLASLIPPRFHLRASVFPADEWPAIRKRLDYPADVAAVGLPVLEAAIPTMARSRLSSTDAAKARNLQFRIADAARRALRCLTKPQVAAILTNVPAEYHALLMQSLAETGAALGVRNPLKRFYEALQSKEATTSEAAAMIIRTEQIAFRCSLFSDDRRRYTWEFINEQVSTPGITLASVCRAYSHHACGRSDMPQLPPPYLGCGEGCHVVDELTAIERFPPSIGFMAMRLAMKLDDNELWPHTAPEIITVLSGFRWQTFEVLAYTPSPSTVQETVAEAESPWRERARIRSLVSLPANERKTEEYSILNSLTGLPGGIYTAQALELLVERALYLDTTELIDLALAVPGLNFAESACLRLRLLPLASRPKQIDILEQALATCANIPHELLRAEIVREVSSLNSFRDEIAVPLQRILSSFSDPVHQAYATGKQGAVLSELADRMLNEDSVLGTDVGAPLLIYANLDDALINDGHKSSEQAIPHVRDNTNLEELTHDLITLSIASPRGISQFCRNVTEHIPDVDMADHLNTITTVSQEGLGPATVKKLAFALGSDRDEIRARAKALFLPELDMRADGSGWGLSAAGCGVETLLELGDAMLNSSVSCHLQIAWRLESTVLDSVDIANAIFDVADGNSKRANAARAVIQKFKCITPEVQQLLPARARICSPELRYALSILLARLMHFQQSRKNEEPHPLTDLLSEILPLSLPCEPDPQILLLGLDELVSTLIAHHAPEAVMREISHQRSRPLTAFLAETGDVALRSFQMLGSTFFSRTMTQEEQHKDFTKAAEKLLLLKDGCRKAADVLLYLLRSSLEDPWPGSHLRSDLVVMLAAAAEKKPALVVGALESAEMRSALGRVARFANSYPARRAAFLLIGYLLDQAGRSPVPDEIHALTSVVIDVPDVIDGALTAASRIRRLGSGQLAKLQNMLRGQSAARSVVAARMLIGIARNKESDLATRAAILHDLGTFIAEQRSNRAVYYAALDASTPVSPTIREIILEELSASTGGVVRASRSEGD